MKTLVIVSGGLDSATLLWLLHRQGHELLALGIDYGQRHRKELAHAAALCDARGVSFAVADLTALRGLLGGSSQTSEEVAVPEGHYADASMRQTVVPNRNMILLSVAAGYAVSRGFEAVAYAAHAGDHPIYPDCRPVFIERLASALEVANYDPIRLVAPFTQMSKADIARLAGELAVPIEQTWSCYAGGELHCGRCGTCVERIQAMHEAGLPDRTVYADSAFALRVQPS